MKYEKGENPGLYDDMRLQWGCNSVIISLWVVSDGLSIFNIFGNRFIVLIEVHLCI